MPILLGLPTLLMGLTVAGLAQEPDPRPEIRNPSVEDAPSLHADEGGILFVDAKVPTELLVDGVKLAQLWFPGEVSFRINEGPHQLRVYTYGNPSDFPITISEGVQTRVLVGRTGITLPVDAAGEAPTAATTADDGDTVKVEFRSVGGGTMVRLGKERMRLANGERSQVGLAPGSYSMSVRSFDGTVVWAKGTLEVPQGGPLIVQLAEGRLPELSGGGRFHAGGR